MEVYGCGYDDDVDYQHYNKRNNQTHTMAMIEQLERIVTCYELALLAIDMQARDSLLNKSPTYKS